MWRESKRSPGRPKNSTSKFTLMRTGRLKSPLPLLNAHVRQALKSKQLNINRLAKMMNVKQPTASYLMNRGDWYVSELMLVGELLGVNLFEFYVPKITDENTQLKSRIAQMEEEMKLIKHENALLKEIAGRK